MLSWFVRRVVAFVYAKVASGDLRIPLLAIGDDACLVFPGESSFGGEFRGKRAIEAWMRRFSSLRPAFTVTDAGVAGGPWNMRVFMRFTDRIVAPDGHVYENEGMEYIAIKWGLIREIRVNLDTARVAELDAHLGADHATEPPKSKIIPAS